jgi:hypothetical protein
VQQHLLDTLSHLDGSQAGNLPYQMQSALTRIHQRLSVA